MFGDSYPSQTLQRLVDGFGIKLAKDYADAANAYANNQQEMMLKEIREKLVPLIRKKCPFKSEPATNAPVTWVKPELVCEVEFHGWTDEGIMRQPVFLRLRDDKAAHDVARENL